MRRGCGCSAVVISRNSWRKRLLVWLPPLGGRGPLASNFRLKPEATQATDSQARKPCATIATKTPEADRPGNAQQVNHAYDVFPCFCTDSIAVDVRPIGRCPDSANWRADAAPDRR